MSNIEQIKEILKIKKDIYQSIVKKGSDINKTAPFKNYAQKISEIKTTSGKVDLGDLKITKFSPKPNDSEMTFTDNDGNELLNFGNMVITNQNEQINYTAKHVGMQDLSGSTIADTNKEIQVLLQRLGQGVKKIKLCGQYGTYLIMDNGDLYAAGHSRLLGNPSSTYTVTEFTKVAENVRDACCGMLYEASLLTPMYVTENDELFIASTYYYSKSGKFEKIAENVKSIHESYINAFYITNDGILYAMGDDTYRQISNNGNEAKSFIEIATNVDKLRTFTQSTYYITKDKVLFGTGAKAGPSNKYLYAFQQLQKNVEDVRTFWWAGDSKYGITQIDYRGGNNALYFSDGSHTCSVYIDFDKKELCKNIKKYICLRDNLYYGGYVWLDDGYIYTLSQTTTSNVYYLLSKTFDEKILKVQTMFDYTWKGMARDIPYVLLALSENGNLYRIYYNPKNNIVSSTIKESGIDIIAKDVIDFDISSMPNMTMYNSGYVTTKGDAYLVGYNKLGNLGIGNTTDVINSYTRVSFAENNV